MAVTILPITGGEGGKTVFIVKIIDNIRDELLQAVIFDPVMK